MDDLPQADPELRERLTCRLANEGVDALAAELRELDPAYYATVDRKNPARVMRALEVCLQTGRPYSEQRTGVRRPRPFGIVKVGVDLPREELYARIDRRVDRMVADGLEAEARALYPYRTLNALQTVGYREFFDYFDGRTSYEEAVSLIKRNSRRYAKRQLTSGRGTMRRSSRMRMQLRALSGEKDPDFGKSEIILYFCACLFESVRPDGGIGRHAGLKILWPVMAVPVRSRLRVRVNRLSG